MKQSSKAIMLMAKNRNEQKTSEKMRKRKKEGEEGNEGARS